MKRIWILLLASLMAIPASAMYTGATEMHNHGGCVVGHFNYTSGMAQGEFVKFGINSNGEIQNYQVNGTTVFESITYQNATNGKVWVKGATLFYYGAGATLNVSGMGEPKMNYMWRFIHAHDNPAGVLHMVIYGEDTITYELAQGLNARVTGEHLIEINGPISGIIVFTGSASISGNTVKISLGVKNYTFGSYSFHGGSAVFVRTDTWQVPPEIRQKIIKGIESGKVAGQIDISGSGNSDFMNYTYDFHANVNMENKGIRITVSSENHTGKVVVVNIDKSKLRYDSNHKIVVKIDGKDIKISSETDVLAGGSESKYAVINGTSEVTVLIYVSHFSTHTIDIQSQSTGSGGGENTQSNQSTLNWLENPLILGIVILVVIVIIAAVVIIKKR